MRLRTNPKRTAKALDTDTPESGGGRSSSSSSAGKKPKTPESTGRVSRAASTAASSETVKTPASPSKSTPKNASPVKGNAASSGINKGKAESAVKTPTVEVEESIIVATTDDEVKEKESPVVEPMDTATTEIEQTEVEDTVPINIEATFSIDSEVQPLEPVPAAPVTTATKSNEEVTTVFFVNKPATAKTGILRRSQAKLLAKAKETKEVIFEDSLIKIEPETASSATPTIVVVSTSSNDDESSASVSAEKDTRQLVVKLDKIASSERSTPAQKRKLVEDAPKPTAAKRRQSAKSKTSNQDEVRAQKPAGEGGKDERSFEKFYAKVKESSVVSERWSFGGVLWDPTKKMKVMAASEVDVTSNGNIRLRRCVQVFENMTVRVMVEGTDMTKHFTTTGAVKTANELSQLIHKVASSKICSGIKNFGATDKVYFPHCVLRGDSYFAPECPVVIDYGVVGPLCQHCNRLRNMIHRRNVKDTNLLFSKFSRAPVKNIRSGFGKQLYSMLTDMIEASSVDAKKERKKLRRMIPANAKEYPFRMEGKGELNADENLLQQQQIQLITHQQFQPQQFFKSDAAGNITRYIDTPSTVSSDFIRLAKPFMSGGSEVTFNMVSGQRGTYKVSRNDGGQRAQGGNYSGTVLTPGEMQMVEQLVLQEGHDVGNVIIQNSGDFTLAEGQEYELIGEADPDNPMRVLEVLQEGNEANNTIEIIEVDDQTLAQLQSQNLSNFIIQEQNSDFEVQEIDANDPNFRHLMKGFNPGTVVYQS